MWIANKENGVSRVTLSEDLRQVRKFKDYNNKTFPLGYDACLSEVDGDVVVTSHHDLWSYDQTRDCLERFTRLENLLDRNKKKKKKKKKFGESAVWISLHLSEGRLFEEYMVRSGWPVEGFTL